METKSNIPNYVIVCNIQQDNMLYYYTGVFTEDKPYNSPNYIKAVKLIFKDEAQQLVDNLNLIQSSYIFRVEEHMYM